MECPYCKGSAELVTGKVVYPHRPDLAHKKFWSCLPCDAFVGCHAGTETPLGTLANRPTRRARNMAHEVFDGLWRAKMLTRSEAYEWLRGQLGLSAEACHIGMFTPAQCSATVAAVKALSPEAIKGLNPKALRRFRCPLCRRGFKKEHALQQHVHDAHPAEKVAA